MKKKPQMKALVLGLLMGIVASQGAFAQSATSSALSGLARFFDGAKKDLEAKSLTKVGDLTVATPVAPEAPAETPAPEAPVAEEPKAE